jgi:phospholipase C
MMRAYMKRRDVLKLAGAAGLAPLVKGCSDGPSGPGTIDTFVYLMLENRSYDHAFGARAFVEGLGGDGPRGDETNPDTGGAQVALWKGEDGTLCVPDPAHGWEASHVQFNNGAMDGFLTTHQEDHPGDLGAMQYLTRELMPVSYALADEYAICDRWFCSVMGPTWPNRYFWMSGQSMGMQNNDPVPGGYTAPLIFHRLDEAGVPWRLYYGDLPFFALTGGHIEGIDERLFRLDDFFEDAERGELPSVTYIDPAFSYGDDHPPHHPIYGQQLIATIYDALTRSPQWERTLFLVTYDEHGGFYDHVPPPTTTDDRAAEGFDQLGFRVPALVVGPYVKRGHVSSVVRDHTSALKHLENTFGLAPLTARTTAAEDLSELIDLERLEAGDAGAPIALPAVDVADWQIDDACNSKQRKDHHILAAADRLGPAIAKWDRRANVRELAHLINARARRAAGR